MILTLTLCLLCQATTTPAADKSKTKVGEFINAVSAILDSSSLLWDKIYRIQADYNVQKVSSGATSLEASKAKLALDIREGKIKDGDTLQERVHAITQELNEYQGVLDGFAIEIDKSSRNIGNDIRATSDALIVGKNDRLNAVLDLWKPNDPAAQERAAKQVDEAMNCSKEIAISASCLSHTIQDKRRDPSPECTKEALEKSRKACTTR
jgi:hypothetical protein